jgi:phage tail-like protein
MAEPHHALRRLQLRRQFDGGEVFGGFSDVSGIGTEVTVAEYRNGNDKENHVRKVAGVHKVSDVTLKRGIVNSKTASVEWIDEPAPPARRQKTVAITLLDESPQPGAVLAAARRASR